MSQNIIIQEISEDTISLNINGEMREIQNQLSELKKMLASQDKQTVQYAEKIYNIEHINEANFGLFTGKQAFNEILIKNLTEAIQPYSKDAQMLIDYMQKQQIAHWANQEKYAKKAKEILAYSYVGVIGMQLSHLLAIGNNKTLKADDKIVPYIEKSLHIARYSLDLICFVFISKLWDTQKNQNITLKAHQTAVLEGFFGRKFEPEFAEQLALLQELYGIFEDTKIALPFAEMKDFSPLLQPDSALAYTCKTLQTLKHTPKEKYTFVECAEAETKLSDLMRFLSFLANYNMASIKKVGYKFLRNNPPHFIHNYIEVGFDQKANPDVEKHKYTPQDIATDTVLIYQGENYSNSVNLFPFVIDFNALTFEQGSKIYFYQCVGFSSEKILEYVLLKDDEVQKLEFEGVLDQHPNLDDLVGKETELKKMNLDHVILQFKEAKNALTQSTETDNDFDNLFN